MSEEFKAIETQEAFDAAFKARIERNTRSVTEEVTKKFEGWISPEQAQESAAKAEETAKKLAELTAQIETLTAEKTASELGALKLRIAYETGLPQELAGRLAGATEEELRKDAESLAKFAGRPAATPGFTQTEYTELSGVEKAFFDRNPDLPKPTGAKAP